ncbi:putative fha domain-containing protein [Golovinomyces cichoracearum]|uniref:Putative fha domain-containing protein n=1 Tax=Golovinomyces cichoracearum TaxID=62708 RepID=A0A420I7B5_9PEZI|nr:putative fha domain-containing protein [Golovinomyces cichoracearum]
MTAVISLPNIQQNNRLGWNVSGGQVTFDCLNTDEASRNFMPKKTAHRSYSSPFIDNSNRTQFSPATTAQSGLHVNGTPMSKTADPGPWATVGNRKPPPKMVPMNSRKTNSSSFKSSSARPSLITTPNECVLQTTDINRWEGNELASSKLPPHHSALNFAQQTNRTRSLVNQNSENIPVLCLFSTNRTFDRKTIHVPFYPESIRIGRQTNNRTIPTPINGYFDSKVLSRQHAELWADKNGKIWIRDIKSSNGTFVNGNRLSAENKNSEPHELEAHDKLELGIDIVAEDQKTVVHHKVAAEVEYAGFYIASTDHSETNFGNYDHTGGTNIGPFQVPMLMRGRMDCNGSFVGNYRGGVPISNAGSQMSLNQQRQMKLLMAPVTIERIVNRLTVRDANSHETNELTNQHEMRAARLQTDDLERANDFLGLLLSDDCSEDPERPIMTEPSKQKDFSSNVIRTDQASCFSAPPAPPPQQPLPEKPEFTRSTDPHQLQHSNSKRISTHRTKSISSISPPRSENSGQILTLTEALASARREIECQSAKLRDLEELLKKEKKAREIAEDFAKRLESQSIPKTNGLLTRGLESTVTEETFEPCLEFPGDNYDESKIKSEPHTEKKTNKSIEICLDTLSSEIRELKGQLKIYKPRALSGEPKRDANQKNMSEIIEKIRFEDVERFKLSPNKSRSSNAGIEVHNSIGGNHECSDANNRESAKQDFKSQGKSRSSAAAENDNTSGILVRNKICCDQILNYHTAPFASILGVVLIGVGIMSYLNGWKVMKVER